MNKLLITLEIPSMGEQFDMLAPADVEVRVLAPLLAEAAAELSDHRYVPSGSELLCSRERAMLFRQDGTLCSYGVRNGDHLMLF